MAGGSARCESGRVDVALVVGGRWHDMDFARLELLRLLGDHDAVRCSVHEDFADTDRLSAVDAVIAYTCDVRPTPDQSEGLAAMVRSGGRLLGLHGTNSAIDAPASGAERVFRTPNAMPAFSALLGSRFLAHPRIAPYLIEIVQPEHPLVSGIGDFVTTDEIYVSELADDLEVLMDVSFSGDCPGFEAGGVASETRLPVLFTRAEASGTVTYLTLGHCRGRFDLADQGIGDLGVLDRAAWESPEYREVLRRTVSWAAHGQAWVDCPAKEEA